MKQTYHHMPTRRRGSILIFVVGILVLLALMGTAYVSAVRLDRVQVSQIGGAGALSGGWMTPPTDALNKAEAAVVGTGATPSPTSIKGRLLADLFGAGNYRFGAGYNNYDMLGGADFWLASRTPNPTNATPTWPIVSRSIVDGSTTFASPYGSVGNVNASLQPGSITLPVYAGNTPLALQGKTRVYPGFSTGGAPWLAADTDGDGIADAQFVDLSNGGANVQFTFFQTHPQFNAAPVQVPPAGSPAAPNNRIYAAIRVIDNNAALNLNTAWSLADAYTAGGAAPNYGWFRSNVGLLETMSNTAAFDPWRRGAAGGTFTTVAEALEMNLGRTLQGTSAVDETDTASLVYHGGMVDPDKSSPNSAEGQLLDDLYYSAANFAYDPSKRFRYFPADEVDAWHKATFLTTGGRAYYGYTPPLPAPKRMQVVSSNPLTNYAPGINVGGQALVFGRPWTNMPDQSTRAPTKVGINTADFPHLWRGFWNVLTTDPAAPTTPFAVANQGPASVAAGQRRLELRSAIAAVNAEDMRDADITGATIEDTITSHKITLDAGTGLVATVFGSERQPFISKVVQNSPTQYTVTLINPYVQALPLGGYAFSVFNAGTVTPCTGAPVGNLLAQGDTQDVVVDNVTGTQLLLVRPRNRQAGAAAANVTLPDGQATDSYNEVANLADWVPVDGVSLTTASALNTTYARSTAATWDVANGNGDFKPAAAPEPAKPCPVAMSNTPPDPRYYPYGGFARVGDVMMVPYLGTYVITQGATIVEIVPVTQDVGLYWGGGQFIGRPIPDPSDTTSLGVRIFEVFSVTANPNDDRLPNIASGADQPGNGTQNDALAKPVHGFVNLNTAPLEVLQKLPFAVNGAGVVDAAEVTTAANAVIAARPILSLVTLAGTFGPGALTPINGYFLPGEPVYDRFAEFNQVNRISNIATTRSDSYTVYVLLQAWQEAQQANPVLVAERRIAFILDRSQASAVNTQKLNLPNVKTD